MLKGRRHVPESARLRPACWRRCRWHRPQLPYSDRSETTPLQACQARRDRVAVVTAFQRLSAPTKSIRMSNVSNKQEEAIQALATCCPCCRLCRKSAGFGAAHRKAPIGNGATASLRRSTALLCPSGRWQPPPRPPARSCSAAEGFSLPACRCTLFADHSAPLQSTVPKAL